MYCFGVVGCFDVCVGCCYGLVVLLGWWLCGIWLGCVVGDCVSVGVSVSVSVGWCGFICGIGCNVWCYVILLFVFVDLW